MSMAGKNKKSTALIYLRDWLMSPRGKNEKGEHEYNYQKIYDVALLEELIKFHSKGNFDRTSSLLVGMYYMIENTTREVEQTYEIAEDSFWNRELF